MHELTTRARAEAWRQRRAALLPTLAIAHRRAETLCLLGLSLLLLLAARYH